MLIDTWLWRPSRTRRLCSRWWRIRGRGRRWGRLCIRRRTECSRAWEGRSRHVWWASGGRASSKSSSTLLGTCSSTSLCRRVGRRSGGVRRGCWAAGGSPSRTAGSRSGCWGWPASKVSPKAKCGYGSSPP